MEIEIFPTKDGRIVLKTFMLYPFLKFDERAWNDAIDEAIHYLQEHKIKIDTKKEYKRADSL